MLWGHPFALLLRAADMAGPASREPLGGPVDALNGVARRLRAAIVVACVACCAGRLGDIDLKGLSRV